MDFSLYPIRVGADACCAGKSKAAPLRKTGGGAAGGLSIPKEGVLDVGGQPGELVDLVADQRGQLMMVARARIQVDGHARALHGILGAHGVLHR